MENDDLLKFFKGLFIGLILSAILWTIIMMVVSYVFF